MTISYHGAQHDDDTRLAEVAYVPRESKVAERIIDLMQKTQGWKVAGVFDDCFYVKVNSKAEYDEFKEWYMAAKRMFAGCTKHGF